MREFIRITLLVTNIISFAATMILLPFAALAEILNPPTFEKLLEKLKIPLNFQQFLYLAYICLAILIITYFLRKKFFKA